MNELAEKPIQNEQLWEVMSNKPICNSITVYGCYMNPEQGILQCRVPGSYANFTPSEPTLFTDEERVCKFEKLMLTKFSIQ